MATYLSLVSKFDDKGLRDAQKAFGGIQNTLGGLGLAIAGAFSIGAISNFAKQSLQAAEAAQVADARLSQIAKSMDLFGAGTEAVTRRLKDYAEEQMLVVGADDEVIKSTQAKLLTFKQIALTADEVGGAFDRATVAAFDLAAAGFGSAETNAIQLGKALQDPIKGLTALRRAGVTFTDSEKERIKTLVESNQIGEAQRVILEAIEKQVGGTAEATVTASTKMSLLFNELQEDVGAALLPAFEDLAVALQDVIPLLGQKLADAVKKIDWKALATAVVDFFIAISENLDTIINLAKQIGIAVISYQSLRIAIGLATAAQGIFNSVAKGNPYILIASVIAAATPLILEFGKAVEASKTENQKLYQSMTGRRNSIEQGFDKAKNAARYFTKEMQGATGETQRFINLANSDSLKNIASGSLNRVQLALDKFKQQQEDSQDDNLGLNSAASIKAKVQTYITDTQKAIKAAQEAYSDAEKSAREANAANLYRLEQDYQDKLVQIVKDSQNRLRSVYASAVAFDLDTLFGEEATRSVDTLLTNLRNRLTASKALIENAGKLASSGFKQTFIEQIVDTGLQSGNEIAKAILESSPDVQSELKQLFADIESTGNSGMDALAEELYDKQKLATQALTDLYAQTQADYLDAVKAENDALSKAIEDANSALGESLSKIKEDFTDNIAAMDGQLGGLGKTVDALISKLDSLLAKQKQATTPIATATPMAQLPSGEGILINEESDIAAVGRYLEERIRLATQYATNIAMTGNLAAAASARATAATLLEEQQSLMAAASAGTAKGTIININVKTDTTQSNEMVGRTLGNIISKYTGAGGQVLVSPGA